MSEIKTFEILVQTELSKYDQVIPAVEELKSKFMCLSIKDIDDKENYDKVKEAIKFMIAKRTAIEEKRKELKADSLAFGRAVDSRAKEIVSMISPIEDYLKDQKSRIDNEIERIKALEEQQRQNQIRQRQQYLLEAGMIVIGNEFTWTNPNTKLVEQSFPIVNLETLDDIDFNDFVLFISNLNKVETEKYEIEEKRKYEEREALENEKKALLKAQQELIAEQEKLRKDMEELKSARTNTRLQQLYDLGLTNERHRTDPEENGGILWENIICFTQFNNHVPLISEEQVRELSQEKWESYYQSMSRKVSELKKEGEQRLAEENLRLMKEAEEKAAKKLIEQKEHAEQLELERIAMLSDKEKLSDYCKRLLEIPTPQIKTIKWGKELKKVTELIVNYL